MHTCLSCSQLTRPTKLRDCKCPKHVDCVFAKELQAQVHPVNANAILTQPQPASAVQAVDCDLYTQPVHVAQQEMHQAPVPMRKSRPGPHTLLGHLQASIVDVLQSDLAKIESLVEEAVRQLSSAASTSSVRPLDACEVMEAMNRHHLGDLLPRIEDADKAFEQLCNHCVECKVGF